MGPLALDQPHQPSAIGTHMRPAVVPCFQANLMMLMMPARAQ